MEKKRYLLLFPFLVYSAIVLAKYDKMFELGKTWNYIYHHVEYNEEAGNPDNPMSHYVETPYNASYIVVRDTTISDRKCYIIERDCEFTEQCECGEENCGHIQKVTQHYWAEDEETGKVYEAVKVSSSSNKYTWQLRYDFEAPEVTTILGTYQYMGKDEINVRGKSYSRYTFKSPVDNPPYYPKYLWVEGIGGQEGFNVPCPEDIRAYAYTPTNYETFVSCEQDGETIFTAEDFKTGYEVEMKYNFINEGKRWNYEWRQVHFISDDSVETEETVTDRFSYVVQGDTTYHNVFSSIPAKKIYYEHGNAPAEYIGMMTEGDDGQVFYIPKGSTYAYSSYYTAFADRRSMISLESMLWILSNEDVIDKNGMTFRRVKYESTSLFNLIIEHVGSIYGPIEFFNEERFEEIYFISLCHCDYKYLAFVSCELPGQWVITGEDFFREMKKEIVGIQSMDNEESATAKGDGAVYDLQGRKVVQSAGLKAGIYIINGKKVVVK